MIELINTDKLSQEICNSLVWVDGKPICIDDPEKLIECLEKLEHKHNSECDNDCFKDKVNAEIEKESEFRMLGKGEVIFRAVRHPQSHFKKGKK